MWGSNFIKAWTKTQQTVAMSSAESELFGIIRASCEALGLQSLIKGFLTDAKVRIQVDATAAKSIVERRGLSKVRHLDTAALWIQEQQVRRLLPLDRIPGTKNEADLITKNLDVAQVEMYIGMLQMEFVEGRAAGAAQLHSMIDPNSLVETMSPGRFPSSRLTSQEEAKLMFTQQATTLPKHHDGGHDYIDISKQEQANICNDIGDYDATRRVPTQRLNDSSRD